MGSGNVCYFLWYNFLTQYTGPDSLPFRHSPGQFSYTDISKYVTNLQTPPYKASDASVQVSQVFSCLNRHLVISFLHVLCGFGLNRHFFSAACGWFVGFQVETLYIFMWLHLPI